MGIKSIILGLLLIAGLGVAAQETASSPDANIKLNVSVDANGTPVYNVCYKGKTVIDDSSLGLLTEHTSLVANFAVTGVTRASLDENWTPVWGEYSSVRNNYNEMAVTFTQKDAKKHTMTVRFRVFNDGVGFRYEFPEQAGMNYEIIKDEMTQFCLTGDHTLYSIPGDYDTNEFAYSTAPISKIGAEMTKNIRKKGYESKAVGGLTVQTPLMIKTTDGLYVNIHEAALVGYSAMLLNLDDKSYKLSAHLTPDKLGKKGYVQLPINTPWRTIIISDDARDILASQLILNLNEPCKIADTSWIKPMKFMGVWWEMFTGAGRTWAYSDYYKAKPGVTDYSKLQPNGRHAANTDNVKKYIDFASANGIQAVLVEGWNEGWEDWASYCKDREFLFDKAYPDFDVKELHRYAASKNVELIMHHETSANAADYDRQLDRAFQFMKDNGYNAVKTGYVGYVNPRNEYHSSQWMNDHYIHVVQRAADYRIMVDSHEAVRPTGLCRTYPNWVAQESARGGEFESMGGNDPDHTLILPFTRLKGGPMDYTPGIFQTSLDYYNGEKMDQRVNTTLVKQLSLYVTMSSPIQMAADLPSNYERFPDAFNFIKDVAVDWDNSWYLEAEPGDYITVARKAKGKNEWYVGAATDENARVATVTFDYLPKGKKYVATIYADGKDASWDKNPQSYEIRKVAVTSKSVLKQKLARSGGLAISIKEGTVQELKGLKQLK